MLTASSLELKQELPCSVLVDSLSSLKKSLQSYLPFCSQQHLKTLKSTSCGEETTAVSAGLTQQGTDRHMAVITLSLVVLVFLP